MVSLTASIIFILCGFILMKWPPKSRNSMYGYRTLFAKKSQDTWDEAQKNVGLLMIIVGVINGIFGAWASIQSIDINNEQGQLMFLLASAVIMIIIEEVHLRKIFDEHGIKKNI